MREADPPAGAPGASPALPPGRASGGGAPGRGAKRSATVSLVLVAGAGAAALVLGRLDPSQQDEEALVYGSLGACIAGRVRTAEACIDAYRAAQEAYAASAPRYETREDCERHHGRGGCTPGAAVTPSAGGRYLPEMAAFMMGRTEAQDLPVQPLYAHAPEPDHGHAAEYPPEEERGPSAQAGGYCTGSGARIAVLNGGSRVQVPAAIARTAATAPRTVSWGGFGGTGRALAASGGGSGGRTGGFGGG